MNEDQSVPAISSDEPAEPPSVRRTWHQRWVAGRLVPIAITVTAVIAVVALALTLILTDGTPRSAVNATPQIVLAGTALTERPCAVGASGPFIPTTFEVPGLIASVPVLSLPRDGRGVPDVPPLTEAGKHEVAWDEGPVGIVPGSTAGNALFNAHTWPWSQAPALGNIMFKGLQSGATIVLTGNGVVQCYRVARRIVTPAAGPYPAFYDRTGPSQIAIIVCSGVRAGPGDWLERTIWFAVPYTSDAPTV